MEDDNKEAKPTRTKRKKSATPIIVGIILLVLLIIGATFAIRSLFPSSKTIANFERIIKGLGYAKAENSKLAHSDEDGGYVAYVISNEDTSVEGLAMFYESSSKDKLKQLLEQNITDDSKTIIHDFDWSKEYNKYFNCYLDPKETTVCTGVVQKGNTALVVICHSDSEDKAKDEAERVIGLVGY